jgi:hypothetical protein
MGKPIASLLTTLLLLVSLLSFGQIHTAVSHPVVEVNDQEVHIFYDIINSGPNHRFNISVLITDTRTSLVFKSLVFPGWGLTNLKKKPHWIKGLAAYGCVAGSAYLNRQAVNTYAQIDSFQDYQDKDDLYQKAIYELEGAILNIGEEDIKQHGFCWAETSRPNTWDSSTELGLTGTRGSFTASVRCIKNETVTKSLEK